MSAAIYADIFYCEESEEGRGAERSWEKSNDTFDEYSPVVLGEVATYFRGSGKETSQAPLSAGCGTEALSGVINSVLTYLAKLLGCRGEKVAP